MNKLFFTLLFVSFAAFGSTLEKVEAIKVPTEWKQVKAAYSQIDEAIAELEKTKDQKLTVAILKAYAKVGKKEKSLGGLETFAPYFKKNSKEVSELAKKHLSKDEAEAVLFGLNAMADNVGRGNDPSVKN